MTRKSPFKKSSFFVTKNRERHLLERKRRKSATVSPEASGLPSPREAAAFLDDCDVTAMTYLSNLFSASCFCRDCRWCDGCVRPCATKLVYFTDICHTMLFSLVYSVTVKSRLCCVSKHLARNSKFAVILFIVHI